MPGEIGPAEKLVILVDEVVSNATSQSDHEGIFAGKIVHRGGNKPKPVCPDRFRFTNRSTKIYFCEMRKFMKAGLFSE
jgi:hypothetical protein